VVCCLVFVLAWASSGQAAMEIQGIVDGTAPASNYDRFDNSPAWIGNPANWPGGAPAGGASNPWTGVGRDPAGYWGTLISPSFIVSAYHFHPAIGDTIDFYLNNDPTSTPVVRTVVAAEGLQGSVPGDQGDVWVGKLSSPASGVATYPILKLPTTDNSAYGGLGISTFGLSSDDNGNATSVRLGRNVITPGSAQFGYSYNFSYNNPGVGPDESQVMSGDSGAPSFFLYAGGTPALTGLHWYNNYPVDTISGDTSLPSYVSDIQTGMNQLGNPGGETVKTISPVPGDFNFDGRVTSADVPAMAAALANPSNFESTHGLNDSYLNFIGDLNGDGKVDIADYNLLSQRVNQPLAGDVNGDGIVNQADLNIISANWQLTNAGWAQGDLNGDGIINQLDMNILFANWLKTSSSYLSSVPEPATWVLLVLGGVAVFARRRGAMKVCRAGAWKDHA